MALDGVRRLSQRVAHQTKQWAAASTRPDGSIRAVLGIAKALCGACNRVARRSNAVEVDAALLFAAWCEARQVRGV